MPEIASLALTGVTVSLVVQFIKKQTFVDPRVVVVTLSLIAGGVYFFVSSHPGFVRQVAEIVAYANAFYAFVISFFDKA